MSELIKCPECGKVPKIKPCYYGVHVGWTFECCDIIEILGNGTKEKAITEWQEWMNPVITREEECEL